MAAENAGANEPDQPVDVVPPEFPDAAPKPEPLPTAQPFAQALAPILANSEPELA